MTSENKEIGDETINCDSPKKLAPEEDKLDRVLIEIGEFELPQLWKYFLICIPISLSALYSTSFIVTASNIDYR